MKQLLLSIGEKIKKTRIEKGLSQERLAKLSGIQRSQISKIESGLVNVQISTILKIVKPLNISLPFLFTEILTNFNVRPFVKWAGGKTQILEAISEHLPTYFNTYFEPFVGGGALLFKLQPRNAVINDVIPDLTCVYECFNNDDDFAQLKVALEEHEKSHSEEHYYKVREQDRDPSFSKIPTANRAARMIYLNKACFNGLYRVNSKGYFNVPSGQKDTVKCFDRKSFDSLKEYFRLSNIKVLNGDFETAVKTAKEGDFVYFDPPYDTWEDKNGFTSYDKESFGKEAQARLAKSFKALDKKGVFVMLSNHNTKYINELYKGFKKHIIPARRAINSNPNGRGMVEEVLITNYE